MSNHEITIFLTSKNLFRKKRIFIYNFTLWHSTSKFIDIDNTWKRFPTFKMIIPLKFQKRAVYVAVDIFQKIKSGIMNLFTFHNSLHYESTKMCNKHDSRIKSYRLIKFSFPQIKIFQQEVHGASPFPLAYLA